MANIRELAALDFLRALTSTQPARKWDLVRFINNNQSSLWALGGFDIMGTLETLA